VNPIVKIIHILVANGRGAVYNSFIEKRSEKLSQLLWQNLILIWEKTHI